MSLGIQTECLKRYQKMFDSPTWTFMEGCCYVGHLHRPIATVSVTSLPFLKNKIWTLSVRNYERFWAVFLDHSPPRIKLYTTVYTVQGVGRGGVRPPSLVCSAPGATDKSRARLGLQLLNCHLQALGTGPRPDFPFL